MAQWDNIRVIKPIKIFSVHVGEIFSVYQKTKYQYKSPYFIYSYTHLKAKYCDWDSKLKLLHVGGDRFVYEPIDPKISYESTLKVLIFESNDSETIAYTGDDASINGVWGTYFQMSTSFDNYRLLKDVSGKPKIFDSVDLEGEKFIIFKKVLYTYKCIEFIVEENINGNLYSINLRQRGLEANNDSALISDWGNFEDKTTLEVKVNYDVKGIYGTCIVYEDTLSHSSSQNLSPVLTVYSDNVPIGRFKLDKYLNSNTRLYLLDDIFFDKPVKSIKVIATGTGIEYGKGDHWIVQIKGYRESAVYGDTSNDFIYDNLLEDLRFDVMVVK